MTHRRRESTVAPELPKAAREKKLKKKKVSFAEGWRRWYLRLRSTTIFNYMKTPYFLILPMWIWGTTTNMLYRSILILDFEGLSTTFRVRDKILVCQKLLLVIAFHIFRILNLYFLWWVYVDSIIQIE